MLVLVGEVRLLLLFFPSLAVLLVVDLVHRLCAIAILCFLDQQMLTISINSFQFQQFAAKNIRAIQKISGNYITFQIDFEESVSLLALTNVFETEVVVAFTLPPSLFCLITGCL